MNHATPRRSRLVARLAPIAAGSLVWMAAGTGCGAAEPDQAAGPGDVSAGAVARTPAAHRGAAALPVSASDFPADAPYYPRAGSVETLRAADGRIEQLSSSPDSGEQVYAHMVRSLEAQGWQIRSKQARDGRFSVDATKLERRASVRIADRELARPEERATRITVQVTP